MGDCGYSLIRIEPDATYTERWEGGVFAASPISSGCRPEPWCDTCLAESPAADALLREVDPTRGRIVIAVPEAVGSAEAE